MARASCADDLTHLFVVFVAPVFFVVVIVVGDSGDAGGVVLVVAAANSLHLESCTWRVALALGELHLHLATGTWRLALILSLALAL